MTAALLPLIFSARKIKKLPEISSAAAFLTDGADTQNRTGDLTLTKGALYQLSHISIIGCPAMTCSRANVRCTTIGVFAFHFCVRNGYRWFCKAIVTGRILLTYPQALFSSVFKRSLFCATNPPCFPGLYGQASRVISTG